MSDCRFGVSPVNYPDPESDRATGLGHCNVKPAKVFFYHAMRLQNSDFNYCIKKTTSRAVTKGGL